MNPAICGCMAAACLLAACRPAVEFAPPPQKTLPPGPERPVLFPVVDMANLRADGFIVRDVLLPTSGEIFRWTRRRPEFRIWPEDAAGHVLEFQAGVPEETFSTTGAVTVAAFVNGDNVSTHRFERPGTLRFSDPVAEEVVRRFTPARVWLEIAPAYPDPRTHESLGVLLYSIGLTRVGEK